MQHKKIKYILISFLLISCLLISSCSFTSNIFYKSSKDEAKGVIYGGVDIDVIDANIKIEGSDHFGYSILYSEKRDVKYYLQDGTFHIKENKKTNTPKRNPIEITFYIDSSYGLKSLYLDCESGSVDIDKLLVYDANFNLIDVDVNMKESSFKETLNINNVSSKFNIVNSILVGIDAYTVSGNINISGKSEGAMVFDTVSGNVNLNLLGSHDDYSIKASTIVGSVNFMGEKVTGNKEISLGDELAINRIRFNSISGSLKLNLQ